MTEEIDQTVLIEKIEQLQQNINQAQKLDSD